MTAPWTAHAYAAARGCLAAGWAVDAAFVAALEVEAVAVSGERREDAGAALDALHAGLAAAAAEAPRWTPRPPAPEGVVGRSEPPVAAPESTPAPLVAAVRRMAPAHRADPRPARGNARSAS